MIKQIGLPLRGRPILLITRMITDRIGRHEVLLLLLRVTYPKGVHTIPDGHKKATRYGVNS